MKIKCSNKPIFHPVEIILRSQKELDCLIGALGIAYDSGLLFPSHSNIIGKMFETLKELDQKD